MTYLLNSSILTTYGTYRYDKITREKTRDILKKRFISAIGHQDTADLLTALLGVQINYNRVEISMQPGDQAIVFKLQTRLPQNKTLTLEELRDMQYEFGLLRCLPE